MAKNPYDNPGRQVSKEWGRKARKLEDHDRGLKHAADRAAIAEALAEVDADLAEAEAETALEWAEWYGDDAPRWTVEARGQEHFREHAVDGQYEVDPRDIEPFGWYGEGPGESLFDIVHGL